MMRKRAGQSDLLDKAVTFEGRPDIAMSHPQVGSLVANTKMLNLRHMVVEIGDSLVGRLAALRRDRPISHPPVLPVR